MKTKPAAYIMLSVAVVCTALLTYYFAMLHETAGIKPPLNLQIPYDTLRFNAEHGVAYHHFTGTNISIPANAFTDEQGDPVRGDVHLLYREFHAPEEILLSGIPMGEMEGGDNPALQSAGMFEIKAFQQEKELQLAEGKNIGVQLAAFRASADYKVFQLDADYKWKEKGVPALVANAQKEKDCAALPDLPEKPNHPGIGENDREVDIDANYYDHPQLLAFKKYRWKLAAHSTNTHFEDWMFRVNWDRVKIELIDQRQNLFRFTFKSTMQDYENRSFSKTCSVVLSPVLTGEDYEKALAAFNAQMKEYGDILAQIEKEEERLAKEADVLNAFNIEVMGVWNCDRFINNAAYVKIKATFDFEKEVNPYINKIKVYVINNTDNTVQDYPMRQWDNIYLRSGSATSIIAVLPGNKIAVYPQVEFSKVNFNEVYRLSREYFFTTQSYAADIQDQVAFRDLL